MAQPNLAAALQLLVDHVPMPSDHRARIMAELTGVPYQSGPAVTPDPRDEEIRALKAQLAGQHPSATVTYPPFATRTAADDAAITRLEASRAAQGGTFADPADQVELDRLRAIPFNPQV
jgi:hypothetical protein